MYAGVFEAFAHECSQKVWRGDLLSAAEYSAFATFLAARELGGRRLLGAMAGPDRCFDTVSGRCGHRPRFLEER